MKVIGIILIIVGIAMIVFNGIDFKTQEKVADVGPIEVNKTEEHHLGWPTYAGGGVTVLGVILVIAGARKGKKTA